ncbi:MAG: hypothetical protein U9R77_05230 [Pseudomonadota bacterium]|uniref:hypothetical protein n=1 Tax=Sphingobium naphthae TaxID=1886786 RepID=UPI002B09BFD5|nr:hypothetical protein [Pseudomonadota bacterium]
MMISARFRRHAPLCIQCALVVVGLLALYVTPPASGQMLLLPVGPGGRAALASVAVAHGARLVAAGPVAGSLLVDGQRDELMQPLIGVGAIAISARAAGCGEPA